MHSATNLIGVGEVDEVLRVEATGVGRYNSGIDEEEVVGRSRHRGQA